MSIFERLPGCQAGGNLPPLHQLKHRISRDKVPVHSSVLQTTTSHQYISCLLPEQQIKISPRQTAGSIKICIWWLAASDGDVMVM